MIMLLEENSTQYLAPEVTKVKFKRELDLFLKSEAINRKRGVILLKKKYPDVWLSFSATHLKPSPVLFAVKINFINYDIEAPSVTFVDPFKLAPVTLPEMGIPPFLRKTGVNPMRVPIPQAMVQAESHNSVPFLCMPGVREYHNHPAHTGNSWLLHRLKGEGTLGHLIDKLYEYGVIKTSYHIQLVISPITGERIDLFSGKVSVNINPNDLPE